MSSEKNETAKNQVGLGSKNYQKQIRLSKGGFKQDIVGKVDEELSQNHIMLHF